MASLLRCAGSSVFVRVSLGLALLLPSLYAGDASATVIRYAITGSVSQVDDVDALFGGLFTVGMPFTGYLRYDTAIEAYDQSSLATYGQYLADPVGSLAHLSISLGGVDIETDPFGSGGIGLNVSTDLMIVRSNAAYSTGPPVNAIEFLLNSESGDVFLTEDLPLALDLADFDGTSTLSFAYFELPLGAIVFGQIETLTAVPEPASGILVALGIAALAMRRRRSR